jgi:integrase
VIVNPVAVKKGKTPVLNADEARALLDAIDTGTLTGLRDRALIGVMVYSFARVNAVLSMKVKDYFTQGRRGWVRLHEKGGKEHEVLCHHSLEKLLDDYIAAAGIAGDPNGPLFRSTGRKTGEMQAPLRIPAALTHLEFHYPIGHLLVMRRRPEGSRASSGGKGTDPSWGNWNRLPRAFRTLCSVRYSAHRGW